MDDEAELRKQLLAEELEQRRLQNLVLAKQVRDQSRNEKRSRAKAQLVSDVGSAGVQAAKWLMGMGIAAIVLVAMILGFIASRESDAKDAERRRAIEEAKSMCSVDDANLRVLATGPAGQHATVYKSEAQQMPAGWRIEKSCTVANQGIYPYQY